MMMSQCNRKHGIIMSCIYVDTIAARFLTAEMESEKDKYIIKQEAKFKPWTKRRLEFYPGDGKSAYGIVFVGRNLDFTFIHIVPETFVRNLNRGEEEVV